MTNEELLAEGRRVLWLGIVDNPDEIISAAPQVFIDAGMLVPQNGAAELARFQSLMNAEPLDLTEEQLGALVDAGNGALSDYYHERACACSEYPTTCVTNPAYRREVGYWDTDAFAIGLGAVLAVWEVMRAAVGAGDGSTRTVDEDPIRYSLTEQATAAPGHIGRGQAARFCVACTRIADEHLQDMTRRPVVICPGDNVAPDVEALHAASGAVIEVPARPRAAVEDPHDDPVGLHHDYRIPHDLPEVQS
jgi:hypothetical protein